MTGRRPAAAPVAHIRPRRMCLPPLPAFGLRGPGRASSPRDIGGAARRDGTGVRQAVRPGGAA